MKNDCFKLQQKSGVPVTGYEWCDNCRKLWAGVFVPEEDLEFETMSEGRELYPCKRTDESTKRYEEIYELIPKIPLHLMESDDRKDLIVKLYEWAAVRPVTWKEQTDHIRNKPIPVS